LQVGDDNKTRAQDEIEQFHRGFVSRKMPLVRQNRRSNRLEKIVGSSRPWLTLNFCPNLPRSFPAGRTIVSNRVPLASSSAAPAAGGLAVALKAALRARGGLWFGWSGKTSEESPLACQWGTFGSDFLHLDRTSCTLSRYFVMTNCARWRRESVPVGLRGKGCEAPVSFEHGNDRPSPEIDILLQQSSELRSLVGGMGRLTKCPRQRSLEAGRAL
jgi:hypothetical protein